MKVGRAEPEHIGKLNFYANAIDDLLRRPDCGDGTTIGILLTADRDDVVVEYALRGLTTPLAVSTYTTHQQLPPEVRAALPTPSDLARIVRGAAQTGLNLEVTATADKDDQPPGGQQETGG